jgi:ABC-2 type transport system permease protein
MSAYLAVIGIQFHTMLQYRAAALAGVVTQLVFGFIHVMVFEAFYSSSTAAHPMRLEQVIVYIWLGQAMLGMLPWNIDSAIRDQVRSGAVVYELVRPLDLYNFWYSRAIALRLAPTLLRAIPFFIVAGLFLGLSPPPSWGAGLAWIAATGGALLLSAALTNLLTITLLWTISGEGVQRLLSSIVFIFSGMLVPLPLYPDWMQFLLDLQPFRGLVDLPFRLYMGHIPPTDLLDILLHQLGWTAARLAPGRNRPVLWHRQYRHGFDQIRQLRFRPL